MKLPLKEMSLHEKLAIMESLWDDLASSPETIESPPWHKSLLDERQQQVDEGNTRFSTWETAKAEIRNKVS